MRAFHVTSGLATLALLILLAAGSACQGEAAARWSAGRIDLRERDFNRSGDIHLHGPWLFHWKRLLPEDLNVKKIKEKDGAEVAPPDEGEAFLLPGTWNGRQGPTGRLPGDGFATFTLRLLLPPEGVYEELAVRMDFMLTAYELIANGRRVCGSGVVGRTREASRPHYVPCTGFLPPPDARGHIDLFLRVSNFHHRRGGPRGHILLGSAATLKERELRQISRDMFLFAALAVVGGYHLLLFAWRRRQFEFLLFALLSLILGLRTLTLEEMLFIRLWPGTPWEIFLRIIFLTAYAMPPLLFAFFRAMFPEDFSRRAQSLYLVLGAGFFLSLFLPMRMASWGILLISPLILVCMLHILLLLVRCWRRGRPWAGALLPGLAAMLAFFVNDMLHDLQIILTAYHASVGMFLFITSQGIVLTLRYSRSFATIEKLYRDLKGHQISEMELLELNRDKDRFLSIISHDLRSPFSGLRDSLRYLSENGAGLERDELQRAIAGLERESAGVHRLIENLLEWARSRMGAMPFEPVAIDVAEILEESLAPFRTGLEGKEIQARLETSPGIRVTADRRMLETILRNLISNAIKFTPRGGTILISAGLAPAGQAKMTEITIADDGVGMDERSREGLFRIEAVESKSGTEGESGGGLGLILVHEMVEKNGGSISIESRPGDGTRVRLRLPS